MPGRIIATIAAVLYIFFGSFPAQAVEKNTSSIILLPFDTSGAGKYSYLKDSLRNMLATRLAVRDGIRVLDASLSQKEIAEIEALKKQAPRQNIFTRLHADYIATGVVSSKADGLNVHLTLYPASGIKTPVKFNMSAEGEDLILSSLEHLALEISAAVSSGTAVSKMPGTGKQDDLQKQQKPVAFDAMTAFKTPHPERLYKTGVYAGGNIVGAEKNGSPVSSKGVRKSAPLSMKMVAMGIGDLDGDGVQEIVLAEDAELRIYHFQDGRFIQIAKGPISPRLKIHAMNLADLDKNGRMEIYISATDGNSISSLVVAWSKEHGLQTLHKNIRWYLRPMEIPGEGMVLVGQEKGPDENILVSPGIYQLTLSKGSDIPKRGKKLSLPRSINLFDFALADLNGDGKVETIAIDGNEKLSVYDQSGSQIWISNDNFGGSKNYLGPSYTNPALAENRIFVPTRIIVTDLNNDKKRGIIIGRNQRGSYSFNFFKNSRSYDGGYISCMTWTGSAMTELWHTNMLPGMIIDYDFQSGSYESGTKTGAGKSIKTAEPEKSSATLFVGQIPDSDLINILMPVSSETDLFAYGIDFKVKSVKK